MTYRAGHTDAQLAMRGQKVMIMISDYTYSQPQYAALRTLSRAYGHGWATADGMPEQHPVAGCLWTQALIAELYAAIGRRDRWESWQYGIAAPEAPSYAGAVCHTTGSGRLTWQVAADGMIGLAISRPAPDRGDGKDGVVVLSARVRAGQLEEIRTPDTRDHRIPDVYTATWADTDGPRAEARHGDELLFALSAVCDRDEAIAALDRAGIPRTPDVDVPEMVPGWADRAVDRAMDAGLLDH